MKNIKRFFGVLAILLITVGCSTIPDKYFTRPTLKTSIGKKGIRLNQSYTVELGLLDNVIRVEHNLLKNNLIKTIEDNLTRRGFVSNEQDPTYRIKIRCTIDESEKITSQWYSSSYSYNIYNTPSYWSVGVLNAYQLFTAITFSTSYSGSYSSLNLQTIRSYDYKVSVEILEDDEIIFHSNGIWASEEYAPESIFLYILKLLFTQLPKDDNYIPKVKSVKETHGNNYYNIYLDNKYLFCPSLPNPVIIDKATLFGSYPTTDSKKPSIQSKIENEYAYEAYIDLIENSEICLPVGQDLDTIDNPLDINIWTKVKMGGRYHIGNDNAIKYIIIDLVGRDLGYYVKEARVVTKDEYEEYSKALEKWISILDEYYDCFVDS